VVAQPCRTNGERITASDRDGHRLGLDLGSVREAYQTDRELTLADRALGEHRPNQNQLRPCGDAAQDESFTGKRRAADPVEKRDAVEDGRAGDVGGAVRAEDS
jgi:hypothetical protein